MLTKNSMNQTHFSALSIGARFHVGKSYGSGATRDVLSWEVLEKLTKSTAKVVENHGAFRGNTLGHVRHFYANSRAFLNIA
jgi:hypothetical protein